MEACIRAIRLGFTSVMLDASAEDYETNVRATDQIVRLAHSVGVTVEAELGHIFSSNMGLAESPEEAETLDSYESADDVYTDPATAKDFVERTEVDVAGHCIWNDPWDLYEKAGTGPGPDHKNPASHRHSFVMHGGIRPEQREFQTAIQNGIRKINYYTYMTLAGGKAVRRPWIRKARMKMYFSTTSR